MKHRRPFAAFLCLVTAIIAAFALSACAKKSEVKATLLDSGEKSVVISADKTSGTLADALKLFKDENKLTYSFAEGQYGEFITQVNGYMCDSSKNEFWAIYTSLTEYGGVTYSTTDYGTYEYEGKTLGSASYGASGLPLVEGEIYVLAVATY